jgi:site-specific DNA recombinase
MAANLKTETKLKQFAKGKLVATAELGIQNCVIYTRVSSKEQADTNQSLEWQKKYCDEYAIKHKLNVQGYFGGTYESAKSDERKEFNRMLKYVKSCKQKVSYILVYSLDRFSRTGDSAIYISGELKKIGINIMAVTQPIDTNSHAGALQQNIQFVFSKYDNDLRRQKSIDGMREKLLRGEWLGNCPIGYEYDRTKVTKEQKIIINEKGAFIKQAFEWRALGHTYYTIIAKLKPFGINLYKQALTDIFKNPFYCGLISHNFLEGELVQGKHEALINEALFLKVNQVKKLDGFKVNKANDNLPLKVFVTDAESGVPYTGYIVKKKGLYYYKVNKIGIKINRSVNIMHDKFKELLSVYTISEDFVEPLIVQLRYTWDNLTESNISEKKALSAKLNEVEKNLETIERRHAYGEIKIDIFEKFSTELYESKRLLLEKLDALSQKLSNPNELINYTAHTATKLPTVWASGDYYEKQSFQNMLFPHGLAYDSKIEHYRTPKVNSVFGCVADLSKLLEENKKGDSQFLLDKSPTVPYGLQISNFINDFQALRVLMDRFPLKNIKC